MLRYKLLALGLLSLALLPVSHYRPQAIDRPSAFAQQEKSGPGPILDQVDPATLVSSDPAPGKPAGAPLAQRRDPSPGRGRSDASSAALVVRGAYVNHLELCGGDVAGTDPMTFELSCQIGSIWYGGFTGHTKGTMQATFDISGNMTARYDEWLYATYQGDHSVGGLRFVGWAFVDGKTGAFHAEGEIVDGSCAWEGSTGRFVADGHWANGGYRMEWKRPSLASTDATCIPISD